VEGSRNLFRFASTWQRSSRVEVPGTYSVSRWKVPAVEGSAVEGSRNLFRGNLFRGTYLDLRRRGNAPRDHLIGMFMVANLLEVTAVALLRGPRARRQAR
jgi:hypothetical protein